MRKLLWLYLKHCLRCAWTISVVSDGISSVNLGGLQADLRWFLEGAVAPSGKKVNISQPFGLACLGSVQLLFCATLCSKKEFEVTVRLCKVMVLVSLHSKALYSALIHSKHGYARVLRVLYMCIIYREGSFLTRHGAVFVLCAILLFVSNSSLNWKWRGSGSRTLDPIQDAGSRIQDTGSRIWNPVSSTLNPGPWILDPGSRAPDHRSWTQILDPGSCIQDPGSCIQDPGSCTQDLGHRILDLVSRITVISNSAPS